MAKTKRFVDWCDEQSYLLGGYGKITGTVVFDQVYAAVQHEDMSMKHPRGGGAKYLTRALMYHVNEVGRDVAMTLYHTELKNTMILLTESIAEEASALAPVLFADLSRSSQTEVKDNATVVYTRGPRVGRLGESARRRKDVLRNNGYAGY